jgi:TolB-like protein/DNA-binding response OmpR family regulator
MRHRILVVAEDVTLRSMLARWLMPAGYFVELAETDKRARAVLADGRMALTIVAPSAGIPMFDPGEKAGKLIIATEQPHDPGRFSRSAPVADAYLSIPLDQQEVLAQVDSVLRPSPGANDAALQAPEILSFDGFTIDLAGRSLRDCGGSEVPLTRAEFALLVVLARHAGRVLSRDQLLDAALGRRAEPYDRSIDVLVGRLRRKIEPDPKVPRFIITMSGEGYKFAAQLHENRLPAQTTFDAPAEEEPSAPSTERRQTTVISSGAPTRATLPLPDKPSIAVLPFENLSSDPEQEYFADGMVEEIITALSHIRWLFVIARNSSFTYKGQSVDARQIGRELGVRYLLEGSVRKAGGRVRITAQLSSCRTRSRSASLASSSRRCMRPRYACRLLGRRPTSAPTISICARSACSSR